MSSIENLTLEPTERVTAIGVSHHIGITSLALISGGPNWDASLGLPVGAPSTPHRTIRLADAVMTYCRISLQAESRSLEYRSRPIGGE